MTYHDRGEFVVQGFGPANQLFDKLVLVGSCTRNGASNSRLIFNCHVPLLRNSTTDICERQMVLDTIKYSRSNDSIVDARARASRRMHMDE